MDESAPPQGDEPLQGGLPYRVLMTWTEKAPLRVLCAPIAAGLLGASFQLLRGNPLDALGIATAGSLCSLLGLAGLIGLNRALEVVAQRVSTPHDARAACGDEWPAGPR